MPVSALSGRSDRLQSSDLNRTKPQEFPGIACQPCLKDSAMQFATSQGCMWTCRSLAVLPVLPKCILYPLPDIEERGKTVPAPEAFAKSTAVLPLFFVKSLVMSFFSKMSCNKVEKLQKDNIVFSGIRICV